MPIQLIFSVEPGAAQRAKPIGLAEGQPEGTGRFAGMGAR